MSKPKYQDEWMYAKEVAEYLDLDHRYFAEKLCYRSDFPRPFQLVPGGRRRWLRTEIDAYIESRRVAA